MEVFKKSSDIYIARIKDIIDRAKRPARVATLLIADIEEEISIRNAELLELLNKQKLILTNAETAKKQIVEWNGRIKASISNGEPDLIKAAVQQKVATEIDISNLENDYKEIYIIISKVKKDIATLKQKLDVAQKKRASLPSDEKTDSVEPVELPSNEEIINSDDDIKQSDDEKNELAKEIESNDERDEIGLENQEALSNTENDSNN